MNQPNYSTQHDTAHLESGNLQQDLVSRDLYFQGLNSNFGHEDARSRLYEHFHRNGIRQSAFAAACSEFDEETTGPYIQSWPGQIRFSHDRERACQEQPSISDDTKATVRGHAQLGEPYYKETLQWSSDRFTSNDLKKPAQQLCTTFLQAQPGLYSGEYGRTPSRWPQPKIDNQVFQSPGNGAEPCFVNPHAYVSLPPTPAHTETDGANTPIYGYSPCQPSAATPSIPVKVGSSLNLLTKAYSPATVVPYLEESRRQSVTSLSDVLSHQSDLSEEQSDHHRSQKVVDADEPVSHHRQCQTQEDGQIKTANIFDSGFEVVSGDLNFLPTEWPMDNFEFLNAWNLSEQHKLPEAKVDELSQQGQIAYSYSPLPLLDIQEDTQSNIFSDHQTSCFPSPHWMPGYQLASYVPPHQTLFPDEFDRRASTTDDTDIIPSKSVSERPCDRPTQRDRDKDDFLIECKNNGWSYKDIKLVGGFEEAESTLRGRYRTLTKRKEERVRKPEWGDREINLLLEAVNLYTTHAWDPTVRRGSGMSRRAAKIPWKQVAEYMALRGAYKYGNATVKKKWLEVIGERYDR